MPQRERRLFLICQAAYQEYAQLQAAEEMLKNASAEEREQILKIASVHRGMLDTISDPLEKIAYQQGAEDAAAMQEAMGPEGAGEPMLPGAEEGPASLEQIAQILIAAVQSGEIDEQTAEAVMQALAAGEGGGGAPGGDPAAGGDPTGGLPPEAMGDPAAGLPPEAMKAASALYEELVEKKTA